LAIIVLIAAIAYPSYLEQAGKSKRTVAKSAMLDIANRQEQYFFDVRQYADAINRLTGFTSSSTTTILFDDHGSPTTIAVVYAAAVMATDDSSMCGTVACFQLQVARQNDHVHDACGSFTLNSDDTRGVNNTSSTPASACW
jgi:type IV pilus assembly protein PilE